MALLRSGSDPCAWVRKHFVACGRRESIVRATLMSARVASADFTRRGEASALFTLHERDKANDPAGCVHAPRRFSSSHLITATCVARRGNWGASFWKQSIRASIASLWVHAYKFHDG